MSNELAQQVLSGLKERKIARLFLERIDFINDPRFLSQPLPFIINQTVNQSLFINQISQLLTEDGKYFAFSTISNDIDGLTPEKYAEFIERGQIEKLENDLGYLWPGLVSFGRLVK